VCRARGRGRHARDEGDEDEELLKDEEGLGGAGVHRLTVQPSILTGGTLREYQMQGLNWLIHLYDNGINGILADEMVRGGGGRQQGMGHQPQHHSMLQAVAHHSYNHIAPRSIVTHVAQQP
jgi:hypothetical protein